MLPMKRLSLSLESFALILGFCTCLHAAPAKPPAQPETPAAARCHPQDSADYVPGVDVRGNSVAPADLPSQTVVVGTDFYAEVRTSNPQAPRIGVHVRADGLGEPAPCAPALTKIQPRVPPAKP